MQQVFRFWFSYINKVKRGVLFAERGADPGAYGGGSIGITGVWWCAKVPITSAQSAFIPITSPAC